MTAFINREPLKVIAEIVRHELGLDAEHVVDGDEKYDIPKDRGLFIVLYDAGPIPVSRGSDFDPVTNTVIQTQTSVHPIRIEACSFDNTARTRKEEIALALDSIYAQQIMEQYQCQVAMFPDQFTNVSAAEPSSWLKRYSTTVNVLALYGKVVAVDFFDKFNRATVDQTTLPPEVLES